jgi:hypothetical protein
MTTAPSSETSSADDVSPSPSRHPARYSDRVLTALAAILDDETTRLNDGRALRVVDPFAGTGLIHSLASSTITTLGVELEPEWAAQHAATIVGDALDLAAALESVGWIEPVDVVATSPCFGNRMADHHDAKDECKTCVGCGEVQPDVDSPPILCPDCGGTGLSRRNTYAHALGRKPSDGSAAILQWGPRYREFHREFIGSAAEVLKPGGLLAVNIKNHIRGGRVAQVVEWWLSAMLTAGLDLDRVVPIKSRGNRQGANGSARLDREFWLCVRLPE